MISAREPGARGTGKGATGGFTLFEVMVAVAILAMVMVSLLGLKNRSTLDVMLSDHLTTATLLAKRVMTESLTSQVKEGEDEGGFPEEEFKEFTWKKTVGFMPVPGAKIMEVHVLVLWKEGGRPEQVELVSYE